MTWEESVKELRNNPANHQVIIDNYFDEDIDSSIERFRESEEFKAVIECVNPNTKSVLDIGAGRGMAAYAFAKMGIHATALEPDPSNDVGAGAIRSIASRHQLPIDVVETFGESLPFGDNQFDLVYVRQVLHHANDLETFCKEVYRVLKPGGVFIATREHVLSKDADLDIFLNKHPLHHLYGGEHAYTLKHYTTCLNNAGFQLEQILHPYSSVINFAPISVVEMKNNFAKKLSNFIGETLAMKLLNVTMVYKLLAKVKAHNDHTPGRLYSFVCKK